MKGNYIARAVTWGINVKNEKERAEVVFQIKDMPVRRTAYLYMHTEATFERTIESLKYCGWDGVDLRKLTGMGSQDVELVIDEEINPRTGEVQDKVQWVNEIRKVEQAPDDVIARLQAKLNRSAAPPQEEEVDPFAAPVGGAS